MKLTRHPMVFGSVLLTTFVLGCMTAKTKTLKEIPATPITPIHLTEEDFKERAKLRSGALVTGLNRFGTELTAAMAKQYGPQRNVFISPLSLEYALLLTMNGTKGETQAAFGKALAMGGASPTTLNTEASQLRGCLNLEEGEWQMANGVWMNQETLGQSGGVPAEFQNLAHQDYGAEVQSLDFSGDGADIINKQVRDTTHGKIPSIVQKPIDGDIVITNAVYFHAEWLAKFKESQSKSEPFKLAGSTPKPLSMMQMVNRLGYQKGEGFAAVRLPYRTGANATSMYVFLPDKAGDWKPILEGLSGGKLGEAFAPRQVNLWLPKFELSLSEPEMLGYLTARGLPTQGDFSGFGMQQPGEITQVVHKTYLKVDEGGTEAAAATAVVVVTSAIAPRETVEPVVFHADRPFLCAIVQENTGALLFIGIINDPTVK